MHLEFLYPRFNKSRHIEIVKSYFVKQKQLTECVLASEKIVKGKNGRLMVTCTCAECGITNKIREGKLIEP